MLSNTSLCKDLLVIYLSDEQGDESRRRKGNDTKAWRAAYGRGKAAQAAAHPCFASPHQETHLKLASERPLLMSRGRLGTTAAHLSRVGAAA
ncbi:hypothetical protein E2C01_089426 [Portunus trituberculatus]|uniref:Uncharacterized protein n=1 Tax=Portunus trituberculatus TaxID=210409 RepID=A0A5B7JPJ7_PORTR|nr:hypothetical protein [Portunus trituberculatus]